MMRLPIKSVLSSIPITSYLFKKHVEHTTKKCIITDQTIRTSKTLSANRKKIFSKVLSVESWHEPFVVDGSTSAVYVELSFCEGRIGGDDPDFPFTFAVSLKRALVTVHIERPMEIDRKSISRRLGNRSTEVVSQVSTESSKRGSSKAGIQANNVLFVPTISASVQDSNAVSSKTDVKYTEKRNNTEVTPIPNGANSYSWQIRTLDGSGLSGQPWDPVKEPRLSIKPPKRLQKVTPAVSVTVSCDLSDVKIEDIQPKKESTFGAITRIMVKPNQYAVAVQHLKRVLREYELEPEHLDNRFAEIVLGMVLASEE